MATKRKSRKRISKKKKAIIDKCEMSLCEYMLQIDAFDKLKFYDEVYEKYMERLEIKDKTRADCIKKTASDLAAKKEYRMILYIFQRIVPTLCNSEPVKFLQQALKEADNGDIDSLCVFLQIAGFRWTLIEKSYKKIKTSRTGREANKWWNKKEYKYLRPLFEEEPGVIKEEFKQKFIIGYRRFIVDDWLIKNMEKLYNILTDIKKEKPEYKNEINTIIDEYNKDHNVVDRIKKSKGIQEYYRTRYNELIDYQNEEKVLFDSLNQTFRLSELKETVWMELPEWPLQLEKKEYSIKDISLQEMNEEDIIESFQNALFGVLNEYLNSEPQDKRKTKRSKSKVEKMKTEQNDIEFIACEEDDEQLTPEDKVQLYETLYCLCKHFINEDDHEMFSKIDEAEKTISKCTGTGMLLYMFKRIAPTLCDFHPIGYLLASIEDAYSKHDYNGLCVFMQIASFRWGIIESDYLKIRDLNNMNLERKFLYSPKARFVAQSFAILKNKSNDEYNVDSFNQWFDKVLAKQLANEWNLLFSWLDKRIEKNQSLKESANAMIEAHKSNNTEKLVRVVTKTKEIRRYFRNQYEQLFEQKEKDEVVYIEPFMKYYFASDLKRTLLKKMEPWVIHDRHPIDVSFCTSEELCLLEESERIYKKQEQPNICNDL